MAEPAWQPASTRRALAARAALLGQIRVFFAARDVLEVETPLLCQGTVTDPALTPVQCGDRWLQTSPEYPMKRLLAAGSGDIYQIGKAFRGGETGARHNPEFTLLEWYRTGFSLEQLVAEVAELVCGTLGRTGWVTIGYGELFQRQLGIDPHRASLDELEACARDRIDYNGGAESRDTWLDLLMSHVLEPKLAAHGLVFVTDYPGTQAALARLRRERDVTVAERFELFVDGIELANGYRELGDPVELRQRFESDNARLSARGEPARPVDERLLAALESGLPDCAGVALGIDRLLMLRMGARAVNEVLSFDWGRS